MNEFSNALIAEEPNKALKDKLMLFGQFIGEWDFEWIDGKGTEKERHIKGEWIFSWILEGNAIQDVFICPSRTERITNLQADAEYGSTVRFYNQQTDTWKICYGYSGYMTHLEAKKEGDQIILTNLDNKQELNQWVFSDIANNSFHWQNRSSFDFGKTWKVNGELFAVRRNL